MTATTFADLPICPDRQRPWDAGEAEARVRNWASSGDNIDWTKYSTAFLWFDNTAPDPDADGLPDRPQDYKLPIADILDGELTAIAQGIFAAAAAVSGAQGGVDIPDADRTAVKAALEKYYNKLEDVFNDESIEPPWEPVDKAGDTDAGEDKGDGRSQLLGVRPFVGRSYLVEDMCIRSDGDGRTVEAYCAAFNVLAEIRDQDGHYNERNAPGSFNKTVKDNGTRFGVFYNHAMTLHGTPDGALSVPIGVPIEPPQPDDHGVRTVTRYLDNPLADSILNAIKQRAITAQSFSGRYMRSTRERSSQRGGLPTITRHEVAMREYGPTPFPAYQQAHIIGTRSADLFMRDLVAMDATERADLFRQMQDAFASTTPVREPETRPSATAQSVAAGLADEPHTHSARHSDIARRARVARIMRGVQP